MMSNLRYELKLVCAGHLLHQARSWIRLHPAGFVTAYPPRQVNNIYLDTPALDSLNANFAGFSKRQKLRLRWYGDTAPNVRPWLELKSKENLLGDKKRTLLAGELDLTRSWIEILRTIRDCAPGDWRPWLPSVVQPTLFNRYQREYYVSRDGAIRATLDFAQYACDQRFSLRPNLRRWLSIPNTVVIELKTSPDAIERLQDAVGRFPLPRSRNSKYAIGLLAALSTQ